MMDPVTVIPIQAGPAPVAPSRPGIVVEPDLEPWDASLDAHGWIVTVFDNERNTYEEVIAILMVATSCTLNEAYIETWEIDHLGKSVVHAGSKDDCTVVAQIIATIGIRAEATEE